MATHHTTTQGATTMATAHPTTYHRIANHTQLPATLPLPLPTPYLEPGMRVVTGYGTGTLTIRTIATITRGQGVQSGLYFVHYTDGTTRSHTYGDRHHVAK